MTSYVRQPADKVRGNPLGPVTLNQAQANIDFVDGLVLREHLADGTHNAVEVPWIVGHVTSGTTGYLFDTTYGGGTIARPGTGRATVSAVSGVIDTYAGILANVSDSDIEVRPYVCEAELVSPTSIEVRTWRWYATSESTWSFELAARAFDVAVHAKKLPVDASLLGSYLQKRRRDFLTQDATDFNRLSQSQGTVRKALSLEHTSAGAHNVGRIAKGWGWFLSSGSSYTLADSSGIDSISRISAGVTEVTLTGSFSSANAAACFAQAQPSSAAEMLVVNGRCTTAGKFRFYTWVLSGGIWALADRTFTAVMFGV